MWTVRDVIIHLSDNERHHVYLVHQILSENHFRPHGIAQIFMPLSPSRDTHVVHVCLTGVVKTVWFVSNGKAPALCPLRLNLAASDIFKDMSYLQQKRISCACQLIQRLWNQPVLLLAGDHSSAVNTLYNLFICITWRIKPFP